jgi:hypothetical protein
MSAQTTNPVSPRQALAAAVLLALCVGVTGCSCLRGGFGHCLGSSRGEPALKQAGLDPKSAGAEVSKVDTSNNRAVAEEKFNDMMEQNGLKK